MPSCGGLLTRPLKQRGNKRAQPASRIAVVRDPHPRYPSALAFGAEESHAPGFGSAVGPGIDELSLNEEGEGIAMHLEVEVIQRILLKRTRTMDAHSRRFRPPPPRVS